MAGGKYSVGELERRFLLSGLPAGVASPRLITDRYLDRTRLRVRLVDSPAGDRLEQKLGHKRRVRHDDPTAIWCTSLYLDTDELAAVSSLPARTLTKTRWSIELAGRPASVDEFSGPLAGLILLEVDLGDRLELLRFEPPPWAGPEVTRIEAFTGGMLAGRSLQDIWGEMEAVRGANRSGRQPATPRSGARRSGLRLVIARSRHAGPARHRRAPPR
jgi:CYTH domain-containing protein